MSENGRILSQANSESLPGGPAKETDLEQRLEHVRKLLRDYLPARDISQRLLDMFFEYQNSIFYVCNKQEAEEQLMLMYEAPDQVAISWFCQMFLFFAVGAQFDEMDDVDGESYYSIAQKHIDDAIDENPQNTLWIIRVTLLLCFHQPPMKWTSTWMYLGNCASTSKYLLQISDSPQMPQFAERISFNSTLDTTHKMNYRTKNIKSGDKYGSP